jgi:D-glycero-D-manno-heptose 1,7-bisphosphate phosphatase
LQPAVFFDRDGVLNHDQGYLYRPTDFEWIPGAVEAVRHLNSLGFLVFVVTNQSGVARGYYSEDDVDGLHAWMNAELAKFGAHIDAFYYCPHLPDGTVQEYRRDCRCRKPLPGLILQAFDEWEIDKERAFLVGDRLSDVQAAEAAGIRGFMFPGGNLLDFVRTKLTESDTWQDVI